MAKCERYEYALSGEPKPKDDVVDLVGSGGLSAVFGTLLKAEVVAEVPVPNKDVELLVNGDDGAWVELAATPKDAPAGRIDVALAVAVELVGRGIPNPEVGMALDENCCLSMEMLIQRQHQN